MRERGRPARPASGEGFRAVQRRSALPWRAFGLLSASMLLVGAYVALSKVLVAALPLFLLLWLRYAIAFFPMLSWLKGGPGEAPLARGDHALLFLQSLLGNFLFSLAMLSGVKATSAVAAGVVMAGIPAAVALLSSVFLRERIGLRVRWGIVLAVAGIAWLASARGELGSAAGQAHDAPAWGYALLMAAVCCEASYVVIGKKLTGAHSPKRISAWINLWGLLLATPLAAWQALNGGAAVALAMPAALWVLMAFYALAASQWTVWLWMSGLKGLPANQAGVFSVWLPISACMVGVVALGEPFGWRQATALGLAIGGLLLATWPAGQQASP